MSAVIRAGVLSYYAVVGLLAAAAVVCLAALVLTSISDGEGLARLGLNWPCAAYAYLSSLRCERLRQFVF